jgi:hypothetical protein
VGGGCVLCVFGRSVCVCVYVCDCCVYSCEVLACLLFVCCLFVLSVCGGRLWFCEEGGSVRVCVLNRPVG